jgi:hypothetical protein
MYWALVDRRVTVTVPAAAAGHPALVWLIRVVLLLVVVVPVVVLVRRARGPEVLAAG